MRPRVRRALSVLAVLLLGVAGCGNSDDDTGANPGSNGNGGDGTLADRDTFEPISSVPGVTDEAITYAVIGVEANNPLGTCILDCYLAGVQAYFDYRNAEGGIFGRDLEIGPVLDDEVAQNQARSLEVVSSDDVFGVFDAPLVASGFADLDTAGIPTYSWGIHTESIGRPSIFPSVAPLCQECPVRVAVYAAHQVEADRVATLGYGASGQSRGCVGTANDTFETYGSDLGMEVAYTNDSLDFGLPNGVAPEVTAMDDADVEFVATCLDLNGMKTLAEEMERQGMGDVPLLHPNTYNQQFVSEAGDLFEGDFVTMGFLPFEAERNEALNAFLQAMEEAGEEPTELAMTGWINADAAFTSLLSAGPRFDRATVIDAMNALTDYDAGGLVVPIDWTRQRTPPGDGTNGTEHECGALVRIVDGRFQTVLPPETPWLCWGYEDPGWTEPTPTTFAD